MNLKRLAERTKIATEAVGLYQEKAKAAFASAEGCMKKFAESLKAIKPWNKCPAD